MADAFGRLASLMRARALVHSATIRPRLLLGARGKRKRGERKQCASCLLLRPRPEPDFSRLAHTYLAGTVHTDDTSQDPGQRGWSAELRGSLSRRPDLRRCQIARQSISFFVVPPPPSSSSLMPFSVCIAVALPPLTYPASCVSILAPFFIARNGPARGIATGWL